MSPPGMSVLPLATLLTLLAAGGDLLGWVPAECPDPPLEEWAAFEKEMRSARPGSSIFVPRPFPLTEDEILEDLRHQYLKTWGDTERADLPEEETPLVDGFRQAGLGFRVETVQTWTPLRCVPTRPRPLYFLVRVFDEDAVEIARIALNRSGLLSRYQHAPEDQDLRERWERVLPTLAEALAEVKAVYGIDGERAQYVHTVAGTVRCDVLGPCIAFQAGGRMYVYDKARWGGLYEFSADSPGRSIEEIKGLARRGPCATATGVDTKREGLLSVGSRWVYARKVPALPVAAPTAMTPLSGSLLVGRSRACAAVEPAHGRRTRTSGSTR